MRVTGHQLSVRERFPAVSAGLGWAGLAGGEQPVSGGIQAEVGGVLAGATTEHGEVMSVCGSWWLMRRFPAPHSSSDD